MKTKILLYASLFMGLAFTACDDDDIIVNTTPIVDANSVVTGSADVTANSATLFGTVSGVENSSPSSYTVGFNYGTDADNLSQSVNGAFTEGSAISATISGLTDGTTVYYQAFVKLQGKVSFTGKVKSLVTTDAVVATKEAAALSFYGASLGAAVSGAPAGATCGVVISSIDDIEEVRSGLIVPAEALAADYAVDVTGLVPSTDYYYAGYLDLGSGIVYGDVKKFTTPAYDFDVENDLVDLGLSVKWAKFNIGASSETELGGYYGYGEPTGVITTTITKYYGSSDVYRTELDVASRAYGGKLTLPSADDFKELFTMCTKEWTTVDGVDGYRFTGPNGNSIFFPAAGSRTVNDVTGEGTTGMYLTGSLSADKFAVAYNFSAAGSGRVNTPVYQALSARAVSTARNVPFDKSLLCNTWEIDYNEGKSIRFAGPVHFYGTDDSWRTVTNKEPIVGDSWAWEAGADQSWAFGDCSGYLTFTEDGRVIVKIQDGQEVEGTYTVNEADKTITSTVDLLYPSAMSGYADYKTNVKILSLTDDSFQLGFFRDTDPATVSVNMVPQSKKYGIPVLLNCAASDWSGVWDNELASIIPDELPGIHTVTYEGSSADVMVFTLDFAGLAEKYPEAIVTVTGMRCDGNDVTFDPSLFYYGDIENNGKFRVEFFNIFGKGSQDGSVIKSAFSGGSSMGSEPAVSFTSKLEIDFAVALDNTFTPGLNIVAKDWAASDWGYNVGESFDIVINDAKYEVTKNDFSISYASNLYSAGPMMLFMQTDNLYSLFPAAKMEIDEVKLDGTVKTGWDASKIVNTSADGGGVHHRLELWNCYGETRDNCAFGVRDGDLMPALGFTSSFDMKYRLVSLY